MISGCNSEILHFISHEFTSIFSERKAGERKEVYNIKSHVTEVFWKKIYELLDRVGRFSFFNPKMYLILGYIVHFSAKSLLVQSHLIFWCNSLCEWVVKSLSSFILLFVGGKHCRKTSEVVNVLKLWSWLDFCFASFCFIPAKCNVLSPPCPIIILVCMEGIYGKNEYY